MRITLTHDIICWSWLADGAEMRLQNYQDYCTDINVSCGDNFELVSMIKHLLYKTYKWTDQTKLTKAAGSH